MQTVQLRLFHQQRRENRSGVCSEFKLQTEKRTNRIARVEHRPVVQ